MVSRTDNLMKGDVTMATAQAADILGLPQETVRLFVLLTKSLKGAKPVTEVQTSPGNPVDQEKLLDDLMYEYSQRL